MKVTAAGIALIKHFEGLYLSSYRCPTGHLTIGWGHTGKDVWKGLTITEDQAEMFFVSDVGHICTQVDTLVKVPITDDQYSALVSFAFNVGPDMDHDGIAEGLGDSTLLKKLNAADYQGAVDEFPKWNKGTVNGVKVVLPGLTKRRLAEQILFKSGIFDSEAWT